MSAFTKWEVQLRQSSDRQGQGLRRPRIANPQRSKPPGCTRSGCSVRSGALTAKSSRRKTMNTQRYREDVRDLLRAPAARTAEIDGDVQGDGGGAPAARGAGSRRATHRRRDHAGATDWGFRPASELQLSAPAQDGTCSMSTPTPFARELLARLEAAHPVERRNFLEVAGDREHGNRGPVERMLRMKTATCQMLIVNWLNQFDDDEDREYVLSALAGVGKPDAAEPAP